MNATVWIIDDDRSIRWVLEKALSQDGFATRSFEDGDDALNTLESGGLQVEFSSDFSVTDGPGLFVLLSNAEFPTDDAVNLGAFINPTGA